MISKIEKVVCLVLDKRIDQGIKIQQEGKSLGLNINLFIGGDGSNTNIEYGHIDSNRFPPILRNSIQYPSWYKRVNAYNAWACHKKIMETAVQENVNNLLLLEDDIIFEEDFECIIDNTTNYFNENDWDMIYFGWYSNKNLYETSNENVCKMNGGGGFHGVLLNKDILNILVNFNPIGPFDWICANFIHHNFKCYAIYPSIITQCSGYSYVEDGILDKPDRYKK